MEKNKITKTDFCQFRLAQLLAKGPTKNLSLSLLSALKAKGAPIQGVDLTRAKIRIAQGRAPEALEMLKEELRLFPGNSVAAKLIREVGRSFRTQAQPPCTELQEIMPILSPYTMLSPQRLEALLEGAKKVCHDDIPGNFVECGVAGGGSSALLAFVIKRYSKRPRSLFCFDTFQGMPEPGEQDTHQGMPAQKTAWGQGTCAAPVGSLMEVASLMDVASILKPIAGLFQDTLPLAKAEIGPIALLHLDGDWYESTRDILDNLYNSVLPDGYLQVDDYGHWEGCRKALDEFEKEQDVVFEKTIIDETGISFRKP